MMQKKNIAIVLALVAVLVSFVTPSEGRADLKYYDITSSGVRKVMAAVPNFTGSAAGAHGQQAAQLMKKGLELHGFISVLDSSKYGGGQQADWRSLGLDYVIMGQANSDPAGVVVEGQIFDVAGNRMLKGRRYRGSAGQFDDMVLRLCDALIEDMTGEMGVARTKMAYISDATGRKEVYVTDILGQHPRQVTKHRALCVSPRFTPDNNYLAYSTYHRGNQDLYITDLRQNSMTHAVSRRKGLNLAPAFTKDGQSMVITMSKGGNPDLYMINRKGKLIKRLTTNQGINVSPSFSPDHQSLAFVSDRSGKPNVYVMDMGSGLAKRLTFQNSENSEPTWSPKGDDIAFTGLKGGVYQLFLMDKNGGNIRQLTSGGSNYESPTWSPDGRLLAVTRKSGRSSEICVVNKNGKDLRVLFSFRGNQSYPQWSGRLP